MAISNFIKDTDGKISLMGMFRAASFVAEGVGQGAEWEDFYGALIRIRGENLSEIEENICLRVKIVGEKNE